MNRVFDYNGVVVAPSHPVKKLKTTKKFMVIDSGDRDLAKYPNSAKGNGDFVVYLPRVYENVISIRLAAAEFPATAPTEVGPGTGGSTQYFLIDIEGLNKTDECSVGADRSGYPDGFFAKIPFTSGQATYYNDSSFQENVAYYTPAIGKLDRMHIRTRYHNQKATSGYIYWSSEYSLTFEIEYLDNVFDDFSQFESRVTDRS